MPLEAMEMRLKEEYAPSGADSDCFKRLIGMFSRRTEKTALLSGRPFTIVAIVCKINTT